MQNIVIRPETARDAPVIRAVTDAAFKGMPYAAGDEGPLVEALRAAGVLTISLVAMDDDALVGHIAFSPVTNGGKDTGWYGLGPVSVTPHLQRKGIGSALIHEGLGRLRGLGARGCVLLGNPAYYERFGFKVGTARCPEGLPPQYFQILPFGSEVPPGKFAFHAAFGTT